MLPKMIQLTNVPFAWKALPLMNTKRFIVLTIYGCNGFKYMILSGQTGLNKQMGVERSGFVQAQYEKRKVQRRSFVWWFKKIFWVIVQKKSLGLWTKENLLDDGPKKVFRMMNQRRYFSWRPKEDILYDGQKKIFWMKAKKSFGWLPKEDLLDD